jgi:hypothetical protein
MLAINHFLGVALEGVRLRLHLVPIWHGTLACFQAQTGFADFLQIE